MAGTDVMDRQSKVKPTLEMKQRAVKYYTDNYVPKCLEGLLNKMFLDDPNDIYGYMAEYFAAHSKEPSISTIKFENSISSRGHNSLTGHVFCTINGLEKFVTSMHGFFDDGPKIEIPKARSKPATGSKTKGDKKGAAVHSQLPFSQNDLLQKRQKPFDFQQTNEDICKAASKIIGERVDNQINMDKLIKSLYKEIVNERENSQSKEDIEEESNKENENAISLCFDCQRRAKISHAELYFSLLSAKLSSELTKVPLYESIYNSYTEKKQETWTLPIPLISIMKCGTESPGKLNMVKTVYMAPKPGKSYLEGIQKISAVHRELGANLQQKLGVHGKLTSSDGSYLPNLERPEQIFEFIQNACNLAGVDFEQEIDLVFDIGASYFYDEEKKRYEVSTGNYKFAEDLIAMYSELIERYPVIGFIDGISCKDAESCNRLFKAMSGNVYCFGDVMFEGDVDNIEDKIDEQQCSGAVIQLGNYFNNLTELSQISSYVRDKGCGLIIPNMTNQGCTSKLIPDMAMAFESTFISFGAVTQNETIQAVNHFINIENELLAAGKLKWIESHSFPIYKEEEIVSEDEKPAEEN